jgi:hypothetical protein
MATRASSPDAVPPVGMAFLDHAEPGETPRAFARRVRIDAFERAWTEAGEPGDEARWLTEDLRTEALARRSWWVDGAGGTPAAALDRRGPESRRIGLGWVVFVSYVLLTSLAFSVSTIAGAAVAVGGVGLLARGPIGRAVVARRAGRLRRALREHDCPACGADLEADRSVCGPARCPACGEAWPLLPPAVALEAGPAAISR